MNRKFYVGFILAIISFTMIMTIIQSNNKNLTNIDNSIIDVINDDNSGENSDVGDDGDIDIIVEDEPNQINLLDTFQPEEGVAVFSITQIDEEYIAIGAKNNSPYIQTLEVVDNQLTATDSAYVNTQSSGKYVDIKKIQFYMISTIVNGDTEISQTLFETSNGFIPYYKKQIQLNYFVGKTITPKYIVIHETGNTRAGADAEAHYRYWSTNSTANASTHFVVDDKEIYQMLELNQAAWHVGDNKGYSDITNLNSIGIEIAVNSDGDYEKARQNAIDLAIQLMIYLDMDISQLVRHYDASGKKCPERMIDTPSLWTDFVYQVQTGINP